LRKDLRKVGFAKASWKLPSVEEGGGYSGKQIHALDGYDPTFLER